MDYNLRIEYIKDNVEKLLKETNKHELAYNYLIKRLNQ